MPEQRFAIVGCGRIAPRHADNLARLPGARLAAVVDVDPGRAGTFARRYEVPEFRSVEALCNWGSFDVACICTPSGLHADHAVALARAGKHVVVEKPMALTIGDADRMIAAAADAKVKLFVVKQNRFNLPVIALRQALEAGRFGRLVMGTVRVRWSRDQRYYDQDAWRGTWALDGGVLANQASHHIDLLEWCMGEVQTVYAKTATQLVDIECEDTAVAVLRFKSGALGLVEATTAVRPKDLEGSLSILGERGTVEIGGFAVNEIRHFNFMSPLAEDDSVRSRYSVNPPDVYGFGHHAYLQNVLAVLRDEAEALVDGIEGRKSLELITALYVSAETGREIDVRGNRETCRLGARP
jgi:predicted dehydrogenase